MEKITERTASAPGANGTAISLADKWAADAKRAMMSGTQAIVRSLLDMARADRQQGRNTAGYVSGYRGSPLGGVDMTLWSAKRQLEREAIIFQPGVNEELAATAVHGTQQVGLLPQPQREGVFAAWYGKGPGVDRALDALKHGNFGGASASGGVVCFYGDDHPGKSSTVAHQSEQAMASCLIPSLYPADAAEIRRFALLGFAMSRWSGAWIGVKCVNETVEQTMTVDLNPVAPVFPEEDAPPEGVHSRFAPYGPLRDERIAYEVRLPRVHAFVRANGIDRTNFRSDHPRIGIVSAGKSHGDVRQALALLGLDDAGAAALGISLYKVGCIWPLEPEGLLAFAQDHETLLVVEEKKSFLEEQIAAILINRNDRPILLGKRDESGAPLLSSVTMLEPADIAGVIAGRLHRLGIEDGLTGAIAPQAPAALPAARRLPYFCSGCPHNRSTKLPDGSLSMTGIGCHAMVNFVRPDTALPGVQMGGEGANWLGIAPFSGTSHIFQNMGDGTYYHSGLLAIRAAVAARANITYKILYNDAVAMTGGQPVDGPISVEEIARQVMNEGAAKVVVVTDDPDRYAHTTGLPAGTPVHHRDDLMDVQRELREVTGCTVLIYEQTCAAEKRRRRKRGLVPNPPKRMFIAKAVCEGCGDCSVQSTCVSVQPEETAFGTKRRIDQSSCNKDYSCANGFCPSFITVRDAEPRRLPGVKIDPALFDTLPEPAILGGEARLMIAGIGGSGIVTAAALIGMAAHLDGRSASLFDMTGLAQKNGAVFSHVRIADKSDDIPTARIGRGQATVLLAFDAVAALSPDCAEALSPRTRAIVNTDLTTTAMFQFNRDFAIDSSGTIDRLEQITDGKALRRVDASALALQLFGDTMMATSVLLGVASQVGQLPVSAASLEAAIRLNGVAVEINLAAFGLGRLFAHDPQAVEALLAERQAPLEAIPTSLHEIIEHRAAHLARYQDGSLAEKYRDLVARVAVAERRVAPGAEAFAIAVARNYARLLAYKDEYEVARLLTDPGLYAEIEQTFGPDARLSFNMAPPIFNGRMIDGRPAKREFSMRWRPMLKLLASLRGLRGSWADPFGRTAERRMERELIADYEALIGRLVDRLTIEGHPAAVAAASLASEIRGFGPVKDEAVAAYRTKIAELESAAIHPAEDSTRAKVDA